ASRAATLVGIDSSTDLALFRLADADAVTPLPLAEAAPVRAGHFAIAVGRSGEGDIVVPASTVARVVDALLAHGRVARPWLGIGAQTVPLPETAGPAAGEKSGL